MPTTLKGAGTRSARIVVSGLVQGVGFRPWVARRADALGLAGWVRNTGDGVLIEVHGDADAVAAFVAAVTGDDAPGLVMRATLMPASSSAPAGFSIGASDVDAGGAWIGADTGVCAHCLDELFDPGNRRFRHPFIHCPRCGPRFTIQRGEPFDRVRTSLAAFVECADCVTEGQKPDDRRCHDQTNACRRCGPRLWLETRVGQRLNDGDDGAAIAAAAAILAGGGVLALKGIGGFHLLCRADADDAIGRVRAFKQRPTRPLAVMAANVASASAWVELTPAEQAQLCAPAHPIVLARRRPAAPSLLPQVAPGQAWLGIMLPYTAVHHLLFWEAAGRPSTATLQALAQPALWVVTSANRRGEPLIIDEDVARSTLVDVADGWLLHDRTIVARADDSVLRVRDDGSPCLLRRARGFAPLPWSSTTQGPCGDAVLALGTDLKATVCVARPTSEGGTDWVVSPHLGGVCGPTARASYGEVVARWQGLAGPALAAVACERHPDLHASRVAATIAAAAGVPLVEVGHHHAHIAAVIAEQVDDASEDTPVIGLALDGFGVGDDGGAWGGELLHIDGDRCVRLGHLWPLGLPGGDRAAREPWRLGIAALVACDRLAAARPHFGDEPLVDAVARLVAAGPSTSSLGRLFDAAAALLGGPRRTTFEGEAALWLENLALEADSEHDINIDDNHDGDRCFWCGDGDGPRQLDWRPLLASLIDAAPTRSAASLARTFHDELARALADGALDAARQTGCGTVVLAGGCLANRRLDEALTRRLVRGGVRVWRPCRLPVGDGAVSVGQARVALHRLARLRRTTP